MVDARSTLALRAALTGWIAEALRPGCVGEGQVIDREAYEGATALIAEFGAAAIVEAAGRAEASRRRDNPFRFARWRRVQHMILLLADPRVRGALH